MLLPCIEEIIKGAIIKKAEKEFDFFKESEENLKKRCQEGSCVVIKDRQVLGVWKSRNEALAEGLNAFGNVVFLVRSIHEEQEHKINFSFNAKF